MAPTTPSIVIKQTKQLDRLLEHFIDPMNPTKSFRKELNFDKEISDPGKFSDYLIDKSNARTLQAGFEDQFQLTFVDNEQKKINTIEFIGTNEFLCSLMTSSARNKNMATFKTTTKLNTRQEKKLKKKLKPDSSDEKSNTNTGLDSQSLPATKFANDSDKAFVASVLKVINDINVASPDSPFLETTIYENISNDDIARAKLVVESLISNSVLVQDMSLSNEFDVSGYGAILTISDSEYDIASIIDKIATTLAVREVQSIPDTSNVTHLHPTTSNVKESEPSEPVTTHSTDEAFAAVAWNAADLYKSKLGQLVEGQLKGFDTAKQVNLIAQSVVHLMYEEERMQRTKIRQAVLHSMFGNQLLEDALTRLTELNILIQATSPGRRDRRIYEISTDAVDAINSYQENLFTIVEDDSEPQISVTETETETETGISNEADVVLPKVIEDEKEDAKDLVEVSTADLGKQEESLVPDEIKTVSLEEALQVQAPKFGDEAISENNSSIVTNQEIVDLAKSARSAMKEERTQSQESLKELRSVVNSLFDIIEKQNDELMFHRNNMKNLFNSFK
ncbi:hypothetical protein AB6D11_02900 [Vibrio splendidus]